MGSCAVEPERHKRPAFCVSWKPVITNEVLGRFAGIYL